MAGELFVRKAVADFDADLAAEGRSLRRALGPVDLVLLGIGCIIGTGIFVLTGVAAVNHAGPAVIASYAIAGVVCALAALCYSEFATMLPISGSAYSYAYATLGELVAWVIGWDLILEYALAASAVAVGWSGYVRDILAGFGFELPAAIAGSPGTHEGAVFNLPASLVLLVMTWLLVVGIRESARANAVIVAIKLLVVFFVIAVGCFYVTPANWSPFAPFGFDGIVAGAATVFFAYIGFDAVTTAAEEARNPERDMTIGIVGSLAVCTVLYLAVAAVVTGMVPLSAIDTSAPVAAAFRSHGLDFAGGLISAGAISGLTSVLLVLLLGQSRIFFSMSRDGLLPGLFSAVHPRFGTPHVSTIGVGVIVAGIAGFVPLRELAELANIGTLFAFVIVSVGVIVLRALEPERRRPFRTPGSPMLPLLAAAGSFYLMAALPLATWLRFLAWLGIGLAIYFGYSRHHSRVGAAAAARR
jgi:APA family basic amino acid/polyamine antiporter